MRLAVAEIHGRAKQRLKKLTWKGEERSYN